MPANAVTLGPDFLADYTTFDLGGVAGLPTNYGGMVFKAGDPHTLLIGGSANTAAGRYFEVAVTRDASNHITGFGAPTVFGNIGDYNDGGIAYGPGGVLFTAQWSVNNLGQTKPGSTDEDKVIDLGPFGITTDSSISGLNFVPAGFSGAGSFKVVSWSGGSWYDIVLSPDGSGTFDVVSSTLEATLPGGPEGFVFIAAGNPGFSNNSLLIAEFSSGKVSVYELDANGDPLVGTRRDFITGLSGAEGAVIDPLTGDFLFSTFGGGSRIIRVQGFLPPPMPDSDGDGVNDDADFCPDTAAGDEVDDVGCSDAQVDADSDGVCDPNAASGGPLQCTGVDMCADTLIREGVPTVRLGTNRWALVDDNLEFDTTAPKGKGPGRSYSTTNTAGCSCEQIIEELGLGNGHTKFGCSISAMDDWLGLVN
jgi:hypothetical protein